MTPKSRTLSPGRALRHEVRMNKEQEEAVGICFRCGTDDCLQSECPGPNGEMHKEEAVMKRLTAEEIAELQMHAEEGHFGSVCSVAHVLLAMATRLVEIESAIVFDVRATYHRRSIGMSDADVFAKWLDGVKERGWTSPTQKQGDR